MKKIILFILLLSVVFSAKSQEILLEDLIGTWEVKEMVQKPTNPAFRSVISSFNAATFKFEEDGAFSLSSTVSGGMFSIITQVIQNAQWKLDSEVGLIKIGSEEDNYSAFPILVKKEEGKMLFHFEKAEMIVEVEKVD